MKNLRDTHLAVTITVKGGTPRLRESMLQQLVFGMGATIAKQGKPLLEVKRPKKSGPPRKDLLP